MTSATAPSRRSGGCLRQLLGVLAIGIAVFWGLTLLLAPWNFYFGGHFHWTGGWQGWGRLHVPSAGGDYRLWIRFNPKIPGYRKSDLSGNAYLCTPHGERFDLTFGGALPKSHGVDLTGVPLHLYLFRRRTLLNGDDRPYLDLYGSFGDSVLEMEDRGSIAMDFDAQGRLRAHRGSRNAAESVHVRFEEGSPWVLAPACPPPK